MMLKCGRLFDFAKYLEHTKKFEIWYAGADADADARAPYKNLSGEISSVTFEFGNPYSENNRARKLLKFRVLVGVRRRHLPMIHV